MIKLILGIFFLYFLSMGIVVLTVVSFFKKDPLYLQGFYEDWDSTWNEITKY